jgi:hypothetical protein
VKPHDDSGGDPDEPDVGSLGEEAVKLLGALGDWARENGAELGASLEDHLATGSAACTYCPICRVVHVLRNPPPEVCDHLVSAAGSLLQAVLGLLNADVNDRSGGRGRTVEHINLGGDDWPDDDSHSGEDL